MAYFRCGGGGMPAGLQSGMDAVLNKKFGTSTTYPASGWPDNVNLLGPLPIIISAKAPIVSIKDGADDVPISEGTFYIAPSQSGTGTPSPSNPRPIVGYTGMTIQQTGKNLIRLDSNTLVEAYNSTATYIDNGAKVEATGTYSRAVWKIPTKIGVTYTVSYKGLRNTGYGRVYYSWEYSTANRYGLNVLTETETSYSFTFTAEHDYLYFYIYNTALENSGYTTVKDVQVEVGSTASTYEAYKAKTPITDTFGRTIYGGELNVTTGVLTVTCGYIASYNGEAINEPWLSSIDAYVPNTSPSTGAQVAYTLATPTTYQLTPHELRTFYGANNFYCDTGDSQLNYRADISLYINNH